MVGVLVIQGKSNEPVNVNNVIVLMFFTVCKQDHPNICEKIEQFLLCMVSSDTEIPTITKN